MKASRSAESTESLSGRSDMIRVSVGLDHRVPQFLRLGARSSEGRAELAWSSS